MTPLPQALLEALRRLALAGGYTPPMVILARPRAADAPQQPHWVGN